MHTIIGLLFISGALLVYQRFRVDSDILDQYGNVVGRKRKVKSGK